MPELIESDPCVLRKNSADSSTNAIDFQRKKISKSDVARTSWQVMRALRPELFDDHKLIAQGRNTTDVRDRHHDSRDSQKLFGRQKTNGLCTRLGFFVHVQLIILHLFGIDFISHGLVNRKLEVVPVK
jgi:hypothetical protein